MNFARAKIDGRKMRPIKAPEPTKVSNLMEALRQSVGASGATPKPKRPKANPKADAPEPVARRRAR